MRDLLARWADVGAPRRLCSGSHMAYFPQHVQFINDCMTQNLGGLEGKRMLELGNQDILNSFWGKSFAPTLNEKHGKEYYSRRGVEHTSIDLNGRDGALAIDLSRPFNRPEWSGHFDVVTNSGTSEHVEPYEAQFICFQSLHEVTKQGGLMIHIVPGVEELRGSGYWKYHCNNYYSKEFFRMLCQSNDYRLLEQKVMDELLCVCLLKLSDRPFMQDQKTFLSHVTRERGGVVYKGINDGQFNMWQRLAFNCLGAAHIVRTILKNRFSQLS